MAKRTKGEGAGTLKAFLIELVIYGVLVVGYFFFVLHFLSDWLGHLEKTHITIYAIVAIAFIIVQAVVLESITTLIMRVLRGGRSE